ncbi:coiled-coil and C2 domain-containing protein 2A isoform X1 [Diabrotica undecimpunctata]|uniref:coiled-coil and C2 domain-containing protein 2A isoform X1 n=1 Tax=Diabrotica undecimpunctata TaxID=50387 RepID=UPI003B633A41
MNTSKEELIELVDFKPISKEKSRRSNRVDLSPSVSSVNTLTESEDANIVNLFSVTPRTYSKRPSSSDRRTISEISDDVFLAKPDARPSSSKPGFRKRYKEKIIEHIRQIKERTATASSDLSRDRIPIDRVRKESQDIDALIEQVKNKFGRNRAKNREKDLFFAYNEDLVEQNGECAHKQDQQVYYALPEKLDFTLYLSEKECFITTNTFQLCSQKRKNDSIKEPAETCLEVANTEQNEDQEQETAIDNEICIDTGNQLLVLEFPLIEFAVELPHFKTNNTAMVTYSRPRLPHEDLEEVLIIKESILDLYLSHIQFVQHPLFSIEHIFAQILSDYYKDFLLMEEKNTINKLKQQLNELREKRNKLDDLMAINKINKVIKKIRTKYFEENKKYKDTIFIILEAWKTIKKIRQLQGYSNTPIKLLIKKEASNTEEQREHYQNMFDATLQELQHQQINEYASDIEEKNSTTENQDEKNESRVDEISEEKTRGSSKEMSKEEEIISQLTKTFQTCFKSPEDPNIKFSLAFSNQISEDCENNREAARRAAVLSTKFYLRILCNGIEACKTKFLNMTDDFLLNIDETFSLQLTDIPKFLTIEIYAQPKSLLKKKVCEMNINIPNKKSVRRNAKNVFEKVEIVHYKHEGVGSGIELKKVIEHLDLNLQYIENFELNTSGILEYSLEWEKAKKLQEDISINEQFKITNEANHEQFGLDNKMDENNLDIDEDSGDHNTKRNRRDRRTNRIKSDDNLFTFCKTSVIEENLRLKILQLRDQKEIEFDGMVVPNRVREIPFTILNPYMRRKASEEKGYISDDDDTEYKAQYNFGKKRLKQVYLRLFHLCKNTENNLDYESVVNENYFIYFHYMVTTILRNFFNWFRWRPKISKPLPILQKNSSDELQEIPKGKLNVIVNVISAKNLPRRKKGTFNKDEIDYIELCPYVEVSYNNILARTNTSTGSNASWNEILAIPLDSSHSDYLNPNSLEGVISVNVYDESNIEIKKLNKNCVNWLGGVDILLSAVCCLDSMSGYFQIKVPYLLFDYEDEAETTSQNKSPKLIGSSINRSYLYLDIFLEPNVPKLAPNMEELKSGEVPYIQEHVLKWNKIFNNSYTHRKFNALVLDANGKTTCITRYIKALEPPQINNREFDVTVEQCLRYISLIPFTEKNHFYSNIWLAADQLINFMLGSITDHCIALTCYLLALKVEAWLLLGYGIPHGYTAYVLVQEHSSESPLPLHYVLDVFYNEKYNVLDEHCPLQKIFCVLNGTNCWANIQKTDNVALTRFEFQRSSDWLPLFDNTVSAPNNFITNNITYKIKEDTEMIEMQLEKQLKRKFSRLRQLDRTIWNSGLSSVLANFLRTFELNCMYNKNHRETIHELYEEISQYKVSGLAWNIPFTGLAELVRKIKRLGFHIQPEDDTEFAFSVYVHCYPGRLLSVWIFIMNIKNID